VAENPSILNFPVTSDQIRKYYVPLDAWTISHMRMRNKSIKGLNDPRERQAIGIEARRLSKSRPTPIPTFTEDVHIHEGPETFKPGFRAQSDLKEFLGQFMVIFRDHATGFMKGYNLAPRGKKQLAQATLAFIHLNDEKTPQTT
jgi:hypothetical protein